MLLNDAKKLQMLSYELSNNWNPDWKEAWKNRDRCKSVPNVQEHLESSFFFSWAAQNAPTGHDPKNTGQCGLLAR